MNYPIHVDAEGRWVHTWVRQSSIKTADMCLERFRNDIWGITKEPIKDAATLGTACHSAAEDVLNAKIDGVCEMSLEDAVTAFGHHWEDAMSTIDVWASYSPEKAWDVGATKVTAWYEQVYPELKPVAVEEDFDVVLFEDSERVVRIRGTIDLVERDRLWDWKFPKNDYSRNAWQYERWDVQSIAYCYAMGIQNFSYAIMHPKGIGRMNLVRDDRHFEWLRQKVLGICRYVEAQPPAPWVMGDDGWWCSEKWCANWRTCKGATMEGNHNGV